METPRRQVKPAALSIVGHLTAGSWSGHLSSVTAARGATCLDRLSGAESLPAAALHVADLLAFAEGLARQVAANVPRFSDLPSASRLTAVLRAAGSWRGRCWSPGRTADRLNERPDRWGASVKQVAMILGHANAAVTLGVYSHLWPCDDDRARSILDAALADCVRTEAVSG